MIRPYLHVFILGLITSVTCFPVTYHFTWHTLEIHPNENQINSPATSPVAAPVGNCVVLQLLARP